MKDLTPKFLLQSGHPAYSQYNTQEKVDDLLESGTFTPIVDNILDLIFDGSTG